MVRAKGLENSLVQDEWAPKKWSMSEANFFWEKEQWRSVIFKSSLPGFQNFSVANCDVVGEFFRAFGNKVLTSNNLAVGKQTLWFSSYLLHLCFTCNDVTVLFVVIGVINTFHEYLTIKYLVCQRRL